MKLSYVFLAIIIFGIISVISAPSAAAQLVITTTFLEDCGTNVTHDDRADVAVGQNCGNFASGATPFNPHCADNVGFTTIGWSCQDRSDLDLCTLPGGSVLNQSTSDMACLTSDVDTQDGTTGLNRTINMASGCFGGRCEDARVSFATYAENMGTGSWAGFFLMNDSGSIFTLWNVTEGNTSAQGLNPHAVKGFPLTDTYYRHNASVCGTFVPNCRATNNLFLLELMQGANDSTRHGFDQVTVEQMHYQPAVSDLSIVRDASGNLTASFACEYNGTGSTYNTTLFNPAQNCKILSDFNVNNATNFCYPSNNGAVSVTWNETGDIDSSGAYNFNGLTGSGISFGNSYSYGLINDTPETVILKGVRVVNTASFMRLYSESISSAASLARGIDIFVRSNGVVQCQIGNGSGSPSVQSSTAIWDGQKHIIACSAQLGSAPKLYVDGIVFYGSTTITQIIRETYGNITVGNVNNNDHFLNGTIGEVRVANDSVINTTIFSFNSTYGKTLVQNNLNGTQAVNAYCAADGIYSSLATANCVVPYEDAVYSTNNERIDLCVGNYDLHDSSGNGSIRITGNNVVLDCHGATIRGNYTSGSYGLFISGVDVSVRNCKVGYFNYGAHSNGAASRTNYTNITFFDTMHSGVFWYAPQVRIMDSNFSNSSVYDQGREAFILRNNFASERSGPFIGRSDSIFVFQSNATILDNVMDGNEFGVRLYQNSGGANVSNNTISNTDRAIRIDQSIASQTNPNWISNNTIINSSNNYDAYQLGMDITNSTWTNVFGNKFYMVPDVAIIVQQGRNINFSKNYFDLVCIQNRSQYLGNAQNEPCTAIQVKETYKTWCYTSECATSYNNFNSAVSENISVLDNVFDNDTVVYLYTQGTTGLTHNLGSYWYKSFDVQNSSERGELFISNNHTSVFNAIRRYNTSTSSNNLYEGHRLSIIYYWAVNNTNEQFWNNRGDEQNLSVYNLSSPFNDVVGPDGNVSCANCAEFNLTLASAQTAEVGQFVGEPQVNITSPTSPSTLEGQISLHLHAINFTNNAAEWCAYYVDGTIISNQTSAETFSYLYTFNDYNGHHLNATCLNSVGGQLYNSTTFQFQRVSGGASGGGSGGSPNPSQQGNASTTSPDSVTIPAPNKLIRIPLLPSDKVLGSAETKLTFAIGPKDVIDDYVVQDASTCVAISPALCQAVSDEIIRVSLPVDPTGFYTRTVHTISVDQKSVPFTIHTINLLWFLRGGND